MVEHVVILAGGSGTRLWPASRASFPKQFLAFKGKKSLFQATLERSQALDPEGSIIVVTHESQIPLIAEQWKGVTASKTHRRVILPEPMARNTAPALAYAAAFLKAEGRGNTSFIALPSDHIIDPVDSFRRDVEKASELAAAGWLVTFGIPPRGPETGYGYVETGGEQPPGFRVTSFHEKPDLETAASYLQAGNFYWNSGMFTFPVDLFLEEMNGFCPEIVQAFEDLSIELKSSNSIYQPSDLKVVRSIYERLPSISVDYALMEKSRKTSLVKTSFEWSDVGSWDEVSRFVSGEGVDVIGVEAKGNFVYSDIPVALAGVENLIVVIKDGVALVCEKGASQLVRDTVDEIKKRGRKELL
jgi:mannose-1-phosphate guanylyltransferase/mannose-1-phosphate guanylyltransferase/mannose-6-phosphate isomerase